MAVYGGIGFATKHFQNFIGAAPHPAHQRCDPLPYNGVKTIRVSLGEHQRRATEAGQPQQRPKSIIILNFQGTERLLSTVKPQAARVKALTECFEKRYFYLI
jgi:hypothetical protein